MPAAHFIKQMQRGHPLDVHYFLAEITPGNGPGGSDWKIGSPLANFWEAYNSRSLIEMRTFALQLVNRDRVLNGMDALTEDPSLSLAAQHHANDMLKRHYFAHVSPEGETPTDRFHAMGGDPKTGAGENIIVTTDRMDLTLTYDVAEKFQKGWMYSNGHRENILTRGYKHFGYGIAVDPVTGLGYAVQDFS